MRKTRNHVTLPEIKDWGALRDVSGISSNAIGKSKGGWTTKILALVDALGNLVRFVLLPGNR